VGPERLDPVEEIQEFRIAPRADGQEDAVAPEHRDPHGPVFAGPRSFAHLLDERPRELGFIESIADQAADLAVPTGKPGIPADQAPLANAHLVELAALSGSVRQRALEVVALDHRLASVQCVRGLLTGGLEHAREQQSQDDRVVSSLVNRRNASAAMNFPAVRQNDEHLVSSQSGRKRGNPGLHGNI